MGALSRAEHSFDQCTDTIIRQVDDIKRVVNEFSLFVCAHAKGSSCATTSRIRAPSNLADEGRPPDITFEAPVTNPISPIRSSIGVASAHQCTEKCNKGMEHAAGEHHPDVRRHFVGLEKMRSLLCAITTK